MSRERMESLSYLTNPIPSAAGATATYPATKERVTTASAYRASAALPPIIDTAASNLLQSHVLEASHDSHVAALLASDSSNLSNTSLTGSDSTSPTSFHRRSMQSVNGAYVQEAHRPSTPEVRIGSGKTSVSTSPLSMESVSLKQGSKRTANGDVKSSKCTFVPETLHLPRESALGNLRVEKDPKRIAEISAQLKTRLSYAMVKVQNGWENHSIDQLEALSAQASIPSTPVTQSPYSDHRRQSLHTETSDRYMLSPGNQTSPQSFPAMMPHQSSYGYSVPTNWSASSAYQEACMSGPSKEPSLAPAALISSGRSSRRSVSSRLPPKLNTGHMPEQSSSHFNTPTGTPARQGILRMPSGQAEKDALETLLFMSSPNNTNNAKFSGDTADHSPPPSQLPGSGKRVVFEN